MTYHPQFHNFSNTIRKLFIYLYAEEQSKKVFKPVPFVSFRSGCSLRNHMVRAKVYPLIRERGSSCCRKSRCATCFNIQETDTFQSFARKEVYKINSHFYCDSKCVIYLIFLKYVAYIMLVQRLAGFVKVGNIINVHKGLCQVVLRNQITYVKIFRVRTIMDYLRIVR